jgi:hypothetical protein
VFYVVVVVAAVVFILLYTYLVDAFEIPRVSIGYSPAWCMWFLGFALYEPPEL